MNQLQYGYLKALHDVDICLWEDMEEGSRPIDSELIRQVLRGLKQELLERDENSLTDEWESRDQ